MDRGRLRWATIKQKHWMSVEWCKQRKRTEVLARAVQAGKDSGVCLILESRRCKCDSVCVRGL